MKKTITTDEEMNFVCRTILEDFPALKVEEIKLCLDRIRKGEIKLYERLKGAEIIEAFKEYEGSVRAPILEEINAAPKRNPPTWMVKMRDWLPDDEEATPPSGHGIGARLKKHLDVKKED